MKKWEDIVRNKMEESEGALPESVFAEFRARRDAAAVAPAHKRFPLLWALVPAVAAGIAALLFLRGPVVPEGEIQIIRQPSAPVAVVTDTSSVSEQVQTTPLIAQAFPSKTAKPSVVRPQELITVDNTDSGEEGVTANTEEEKAGPDTELVGEVPVANVSPFVPASTPARPVQIKVGPAAGIVAGGGLAAALATSLFGDTKVMNASPVQEDALPNMSMSGPEPPELACLDEWTGAVSHGFPLRLGLSARFPVAERLCVTTGLEYSLYSSRFTYTLSGENTQLAHYLGIPLRLDWTLASNRWLDVYLGGGIEGDWCLGATLAGERIAKDGFGASLQGAGGIQFKPTKYMGLYLEPQLNWSFAPEKPVLNTYRTEHPMMFSLAAGFRFTIGK